MWVKLTHLLAAVILVTLFLTASHVFTSLEVFWPSGGRLNDATKRPVKVLVLAYPRSGSSLVGELIATLPNASYFFEPLHSFPARVRQRWKNQLTPNREIFTSFMWDLFSCRPAAIARFRRDRFIIRRSKDAGRCKEDGNVVVKTIRLAASHIKRLLRLSGTQLRIVHLIRDPRSVIASMLRAPSSWKAHLRSGPTMVCKAVLDNKVELDHLEDEGVLHPGNFFQLRYESIMESPRASTLALLHFLGHQPTGQEIKELKRHFMEERRGYLSTFRRWEGERERWKDELSKDLLDQISKDCSQLFHNKSQKRSSFERNQ